jgi:hypothetical protein
MEESSFSGEGAYWTMRRVFGYSVLAHVRYIHAELTELPAEMVSRYTAKTD